MSVRAQVLAALVCVAAAAAPTGGVESPTTDRTPRILVLALDGVPFRVVERARAGGAFASWPEPRPLVSTFPSMTNVCFTALLGPLGAEPVRGYEVRHYDPELNKIHGGGFASKKKSFNWKNRFDVISRGNYAKARIYMTPKSKALAEMGDVEELVLESTRELMLAHIAATDSLTHFQGDDATLEVVSKISDRVDALRNRHLEVHGRPLRVILLSDHGNTSGKVHIVHGIHDALEEAGLDPAQKLTDDDDVVAVTYGIVGYAVLYTDPVHAPAAAAAVLDAEGVALSAWKSGESEISLLSQGGRARVRWRDANGERRLSYEMVQGDPLRLRDIVSAMAAGGRIDAEGFASEDDWFDRTVSADYPDGPNRLVDSLDGTFVANSATVIFSMEPGYAWGIPSARMGAWLRGGHLEGTHGGLDRESSLGFFLDSEPGPHVGVGVKADRALADLAELAGELTASSTQARQAPPPARPEAAEARETGDGSPRQEGP